MRFAATFKRQAIEFEDTTMATAFERMTTEELEAYAQNGTLPPWFPRNESQGANSSWKESTNE
jgi:hypothetical protein